MKAVILAAGEGNRLQQVTQHLHKCMIPFLGKPFLAWSLENVALSKKITEIVIVVGHNADQIVQYFGEELQGTKITYVKQDRLQGTAHALNCARSFLDTEFLTISGDVYASRQIIERLTEIEADSILSLASVDDPVNHQGIRVIGEKATKVRTNDSTVDRGIWKFTPDIFPYLTNSKRIKGECRILEAVQSMIDKNFRVRGELFHEEWIQLGDHEGKVGVLKAKDFFLEKAGVSHYCAVKPVNCVLVNSSVELPAINSRIENSLIFGEGNLKDMNIKDTVGLMTDGQLVTLPT